MRIRGLEMLVFGKIGLLCFIEAPVLRFALLPYYRRFETPKYFNSHFSKCKRAFSEISGGATCEKQCTDGQMDMKVYEELLHRQKMESHERFFR